MEPLDYLRIIRGRWKIVAAAVAVALIAAVAITSFAAAEPAPTYRATATVLAEGPVPDLGTIAVIATSDRVIRKIQQDVAPDSDPETLLRQVDVTVSQTPGILEVTATADTAEQATALANALAEEVTGLVEEPPEPQPLPESDSPEAGERQQARLEKRLARLEKRFARRIAAAKTATELHRLEVLLALRSSLLTRRMAREEPEAGPEPEAAPLDAAAVARLSVLKDASAVRADATAEDRRLLKLGVAGILGLVLGSALALIVENADRRIRTPRQAETAFGYPVVAELPPAPARARLTPTGGGANAPFLRPLEILMATSSSGNGGAQSPSAGTNRRSFLFTSAEISDVKTPIAASAAVAAAYLGHKVVLVGSDSDVSRLTDLVRGEGSPNSPPVPELTVVGGLGPDDIPPRAADGRIDRLLELLQSESNLLIIDAGPVLVSAETALLLKQVNVVIIVVPLSETKEEDALRASELLRRMKAPVLGLVTTGRI